MLKLTRILAVVLATGIPAAPSQAQDWNPSRSIKLVVGFAAGGSADILARLVQGPASRELGVPVIVENMPGAGANIAMAYVAKAAPDGLTVGFATVGTHAINPALFKDKLPFRVPDDFTPITQLISQANVILVHPQIPHESVASFIAWAKAHPGAPFGSAGIGTSNHLTGELLNLRYGVSFQHVPYKGAAPVFADLLAGRIAMTVDNIVTATQMVKDGRLRAIAVTTLQRTPKLPEVPTLSESGAPGFDVSSWQGVVGPKGLSRPMVKRLHDAFVAALKDPTVRTRLEDLGSVIIGNTPEEFAQVIAQDLGKYAEIVRSANVKLQ
jgi:tripartite-type tricarboxylate transporter receptor subunit TctC